MKRVFAPALTSLILLASSAFADDPDQAARARARVAYEEGKAAYDAGKYMDAALAFARADMAAPRDDVLALALDAAIRADDAPVAMMLATRADERDAKGRARKSSEEAKGRYASRVGWLEAVDVNCRFNVDGAQNAIAPKRGVAVAPGSHRIHMKDARAASEKETEEVIEVAAGRRHPVECWQRDERKSASAAEVPHPIMPTTESAPVTAAPAKPAPEKLNEFRGISPAFFFLGVGATALLAGAVVASGLDTVTKHDEFEASQSSDLRDRGMAAQTRTNVLIALMGAAGVATGILGTFFVDWRARDGQQSALVGVRFTR